MAGVGATSGAGTDASRLSPAAWHCAQPLICIVNLPSRAVRRGDAVAYAPPPFVTRSQPGASRRPQARGGVAGVKALSPCPQRLLAQLGAPLRFDPRHPFQTGNRPTLSKNPRVPLGFLSHHEKHERHEKRTTVAAASRLAGRHGRQNVGGANPTLWRAWLRQGRRVYPFFPFVLLTSRIFAPCANSHGSRKNQIA
jgi:hypothetical protein